MNRAAAQKCVQPVAPSYAAPSTVTPAPGGDRPDHRPALRAAPTPAGNVASSAWSSPPPSTNDAGSAPVAAATACSGSGISSASERTSIATPDAVGEVAGVREQAVGDVDHRGGAGLGGRGRPGVVRRARAAVGLDQHPRGAEAAPEHRQSAGGPALAAGDRQHVARRTRPSAAPAARCRRRSRSPRSPPGRAEVRSPPTTEAPTSSHSAANPAANSSAHAAGRSAGAASPTVSECARPPIALRSDRFWAAARCPTSSAEAQSRRKCRPSTIRSVDTTTWPRLDPEHRGVVPGAHQHVLALREQRGELADQPELPRVAERGVWWQGHGLIPADAGRELVRVG